MLVGIAVILAAYTYHSHRAAYRNRSACKYSAAVYELRAVYSARKQSDISACERIAVYYAVVYEYYVICRRSVYSAEHSAY